MYVHHLCKNPKAFEFMKKNKVNYMSLCVNSNPYIFELLLERPELINWNCYS